MVWEVEFLDKKDLICYTGIMWKESYKMKKFFCNPWASHFGIDWLFATPNEENYNPLAHLAVSLLKKEVKNEEKPQP